MGLSRLCAVQLQTLDPVLQTLDPKSVAEDPKSEVCSRAAPSDY